MDQYAPNNIELKYKVKIINTRKNEKNKVVVGHFNTFFSVFGISSRKNHK